LRYFPAAVKASPQPRSLPLVETRWRNRIAYSGNLLFARLYHQSELLSPPRLPRRGPAILVSNHVSGLDPLLLQSACRRLITWMMAREYYDIKPLRWFFKQLEAIPVERSGRDVAATRLALRALADGRVLGIFPEGRIETDHELLPFQTGVALMAIKTGVPVYPAYLDGSQRSSTSKEALEEATEKIRQAVGQLRFRTAPHTI
jgi:1-acyl-sn-glycerol-3-phosphate acyltransferase